MRSISERARKAGVQRARRFAAMLALRSAPCDGAVARTLRPCCLLRAPLQRRHVLLVARCYAARAAILPIMRQFLLRFCYAADYAALAAISVTRLRFDEPLRALSCFVTPRRY